MRRGFLLVGKTGIGQIRGKNEVKFQERVSSVCARDKSSRQLRIPPSRQRRISWVLPTVLLPVEKKHDFIKTRPFSWWGSLA